MNIEKQYTQLELLNTSERQAGEALLPELFQAHVERTPEATALIFGDELIDYADLNQRANRLAHHLIVRGMGPKSLVGIALERSSELIVALLGILKAGAAYLPLDPGYPKARLAQMIDDAKPVMVLSADTWKGAQLQAALVNIPSNR